MVFIVSARVLGLSMNEFAILNNRKRAVIALIHSIAFMLLATWQLLGGAPAKGIFVVVHVPAGVWSLCGIYVAVSGILLWLFLISRGWMEKLYFLLCTVSSSSGLLRMIVGDQSFHSGRYVRVAMLAAAVIVGLAILRIHSQFIESHSET